MINNIELIRSDRKTIAIEIKSDLRILVRAPNKMPESDIRKFIEEKTPWIEQHLEKMKNRKTENENTAAEPFTDDEVRSLCDKALAVIPQRVARLSKIIGVTYGRITIRNQLTRWGSCSSKCNLNFNCLLMLCPEEVMDYVIIHELCHRMEMNHSQKFWIEVEKYCPDYKLHRRWLKDNGGALISRMRSR